MSTDTKPAFRPVEIDSLEVDELDKKLSETAARKRIPSVTVEKLLEPDSASEQHGEGDPDETPALGQPAPRKTLSVEIPDYLWVELKTIAARKMITVRHLVLSALIENGFEVRDADMHEDGRRQR